MASRRLLASCTRSHALAISGALTGTGIAAVGLARERHKCAMREALFSDRVLKGLLLANADEWSSFDSGTKLDDTSTWAVLMRGDNTAFQIPSSWYARAGRSTTDGLRALAAGYVMRCACDCDCDCDSDGGDGPPPPPHQQTPAPS